KPLTWWPQVQCRPTWYQMPGMLTPRCGSLASSGAPVSVRSPCSTHELDPRPEPARPSSGGTAATARPTAASESRAAARATGAGVAVAAADVQAGAASTPELVSGPGVDTGAGVAADPSGVEAGSVCGWAAGSKPWAVSAPSVTIGSRWAYGYSG